MDKLGIINRALVGTGNERLFVLNDGSAEAVAAETSFERALDYLAGEHQWPFATEIADLQRLGVSDQEPFTDLFAVPGTAWHLRGVRHKDGGSNAVYDLKRDGIHACVDRDLQAVFVIRPVVDSQWHPSASEVLTMFVEAHIYRGLNEDIRSGDAREAAAELRLNKASSRVDQQSPARNAYTPSVRRTRLRRRV